MADIAFSASMDEKDVQRALQNMVKENAKLRSEISLGTAEAKAAAAQEREWQKLREKATKDATAQMQQLNSAAQRIKDSVATPFEEAKKKVAELREHLQAGRITVDEYRLAYAKVGKEMKEASRDHAAEAEAARASAIAKAEASKKAAEAEREHTQAVREATAVADKYATKEEKVAAELKRLNALKDKGVLSSKDHARAVEAEMAKLSDTGAAADKSGGLIGGLTSKMAGFVGGLASASAVISVIKSEYDALLERQGKSRDANLNLANEQEALLGNLGDADPGKLFESIKQSSTKSGIKEVDVTRAVNEAMAARGDLALQDVLDGVTTAAKVRKFAPSELAGLSAAAIDTKKQTGLDMDQSMGFLMQMLPQSRVKSLKGVAENFTPAVGGLMQQGADRNTAAALLTTLSHGMGDVTGERSRTAGLSFGGQLREFAPNQNMAQTIAQLQQNTELREKFMKDATFEVAARPAIESLLSGGKQAQQFASARAAFAEDPRKALERGIAARESSGAIKLAETDQRLGNTADQIKLDDKGGAMSAVVRGRLREIRDSMGKTAISSNLDDVISDMTSGAEQTPETAIQRLEALRSGLKPKKMNVLNEVKQEDDYNFNVKADVERFNSVARERFGKTAEGKQDALLSALIEEIKGMRSDQKPNGELPAGNLRARAAGRQPDNNVRGEIPAGNLKPPTPRLTAAEQEYAAAVAEVQKGPTRKGRMRLYEAEQKLKLEMPSEYKTAMDHQTAVLERIAEQSERKTHAGVVAARAREGRP